MARNRIIYASQSVWVNGEVMYRVQSLGSTTTFTSEDIFELGHLDIVDVVDDVPAVAVTLNTNDFGDVETMAILAQVAPAKREMNATAVVGNANLEVVDNAGTPQSKYYHGVSVADFAVTCGNLPGLSMWAPVQDECSLGTLANNIDQTMWMDEVFINSLEFSYSTGANATENYAGETDQKAWLLNSGRFISMQSFTLTSGTITDGYVSPVASGVNIVTLTDGRYGFLRRDELGRGASTWFDTSSDNVWNIATVTGTGPAADTFVYDDSTYRLYFPTAYDQGTFAAGDRVEAIYAGDAYDSSVPNKYFEIMDATDRPDSVGALRQGHVEIYIVDPDETYTNGWADAAALRLTNVTISADLTREPLFEIGHLGPYDRPLTLPVPLTVTMDSTAGDLEQWARWAGRYDEFAAGTLDSLSLAQLFGNENMVMVVKIYAQTDEEAGGFGASRTIAADSPLIGQNYWDEGTMYTYSAAGEREYPMKTIIVEHLKITDEAYTLDMGANATQSFGFRSTNDLYVVKGEVAIGDIQGNKIRRNSV